MKIYHDQDADLKVLSDKTIAIVGWGNQGHAQGENLKDSGLNVIAADVPGSKAWKRAEAAGVKAMSVADAAKKADYIQILLPDEYQGKIYREQIAPNLEEGNVLGFSHGFNIRYFQIVPPENVDVVMVAPKGPGDLVRRTYQEDKEFPVWWRSSRIILEEAVDKALAMPRALEGPVQGSLRPHSLKRRRPISLGSR